MIGVLNNGKLCFLWLCSVTSLLFLLVNPPSLKGYSKKYRYATNQIHLLHQRSHNTTYSWLWTFPPTPTTSLPASTASSSPVKPAAVSLDDIKAYTKSDQRQRCYTPVECPSSIQNRMLWTFSTRRRFITDMPIILTDELFGNDEFDRLKNFKIHFGYRGLAYGDVEDFVSSFNDSMSGCLLPQTKPRNGCVTCAVIGNGGILQGSKKGKEIDGHDFVFRTNLALTKGFEEDVGNKTSVYVFSLHTLRSCLLSGKTRGFNTAPNDEGITYLAFGTEPWDYTYFTSELKSRTLPAYRVKDNIMDYRKPHYFPTQLTSRNMKFFHPDFLRYTGWSWVQPKRRNIRKLGAGYRPTTGAFMVMAALHSCDKVSLYGFSDHPERYTEYYFDKKYRRHRNYANHDSMTEAELWDTLDRTGIISLYRGTE